MDIFLFCIYFYIIITIVIHKLLSILFIISVFITLIM